MSVFSSTISFANARNTLQNITPEFKFARNIEMLRQPRLSTFAPAPPAPPIEPLPAAETTMESHLDCESVKPPQTVVPDNAPKIKEFVKTAMWAAFEPAFKGPPPGYKSLEVNGEPVVVQNPEAGVAGWAWVNSKNQVIVSFMPTRSKPEGYFKAQLIADTAFFKGESTKAEVVATDFVKEVAAIAGEQGIGRENVYLTGISMGGTVAQRAAQHTGLAGVAFVPTALKPIEGQGSGSNFVCILGAADPWSMHSAANSHAFPGLSAYAADGTPQSHFGSTIIIGKPRATRFMAWVTKRFVEERPEATDLKRDYVETFLSSVIVDGEAQKDRTVSDNDKILVNMFKIFHAPIPLVGSFLLYRNTSLADMTS
jgi:hypothetical protein